MYTQDWINSFYSNLSKAHFTKLTAKKLLTLKYFSKELNKYFITPSNNLTKRVKYLKIMDKIKTNPKFWGIEDFAEQYILFMFSVDPNFEVAITFGECNRIYEAKNLIENRIGIFDYKLLKLEKYYIKNFMTETARKQIEEEIDKRAFK